MLKIRLGFSLAMLVGFVSSMGKHTTQGNWEGLVFAILILLPFAGNIVRELKGE